MGSDTREPPGLIMQSTCLRTGIPVAHKCADTHIISSLFVLLCLGLAFFFFFG